MSTIGKVIDCRAAVLWNEGTALTIENIKVDPPKEGEVRVRMVSAGICATDAHFVWGWNTDLKLDFGGNPVVLGHEGAGIIESVGEGVTSVEVGDHVIPLWMPNCGKCDLCRNPKTNLCCDGNLFTTLYHKNGETRMKVNGKQALLSLGGTSTYSEYSVIRESQVAKVNPSAHLKNACIIGCAVGTGYGTATNIAKVHSDSSCAIWGLGAIGLSAALGCKDSGAKRIIGIDINPDKFKLAKQFGCTEFINPKDNDKPIEEILQKDGGIEYAFDCIGNQEVLNSGVKSLTPWGTQLVVGLGPPGNKVEATVSELLFGKTITGGYFGNRKSREANQQLVDKYVAGKLPIDQLITHRFKLEQINDAFDLLKAGKTLRAIIEF